MNSLTHRALHCRHARPIAAIAIGLAAIAACGGTTTDGKGSLHDGGASGGASSSGGGPPAGGNTANGGSGAGGQWDGVSCFDDAGLLGESFRTCRIDSDCTVIAQPRCCGSEPVFGLARSAECVPPPRLECGPLGCAVSPHQTAEDGRTTEAGGVLQAHCQLAGESSGLCRSRVVTSPDAGPFACDATTCAPDELCVHPPTTLGGPAPQCAPAGDGGGCPEGTEWTPSCPDGRSGCVEIHDPPPAYCVPSPPACGAAPACGCLPADVCGGSADICASASGRDVYCVNVAP